MEHCQCSENGSLSTTDEEYTITKKRVDEARQKCIDYIAEIKLNYSTVYYLLKLLDEKAYRDISYTCLLYTSEKLLSHHPELRENEFSLLATIPVPQTIPPSKGSTHSQQIFIGQQTRVFNEDGIYEVCMLSRKPKAQEFRRHIRQILKSLRRGEMQLVATQPVQALALQAQLTAMMNSISELKADLKHQSSSLQRIVGAVCTYCLLYTSAKCKACFARIKFRSWRIIMKHSFKY